MKFAFLVLAAVAGAGGPPVFAQTGPNFLLSLPEITPTRTTVRWVEPAAGQRYTVQTRDSLADGVWLAGPNSVPWPIAGTQWLDQRAPGAMRFYRVLAVEPAVRGKVLSATSLGSYDTNTLNFLFQLAGVPVKVEHAVNLFKVGYETISPWGARVPASGVVAVPQTSGKSWPLASYQHGTLAKRSEAPSASATGERFISLAFAATGYVGVSPDYLGLGDSTGVQAYHHARSEAATGVDMLRAARTLCASLSVALNGQVFLVGYSQGGHATMAMLREIETYHPGEFAVAAAAPMAGAYDLSGTTAADFLSGRPMPNPYYFALFLAAYQDVYGLAPSLADLLVAPYNQTLPPLLDGTHTAAEINAAMPVDPVQVLQPAYLAAFRSQPNHPLRVALRDNDLYSWKPKAPMRLYHCKGDQDVAFANSTTALLNFHTAGASQVVLIDPNPAANHGDCSEPSLLSAKAWFDVLKH